MHKFKTSLAAIVFMLSGIVLGGGAALAYQGHMFSAKSELQAAQYELSVALPDKAGHRVSAMSLVNQALVEVNRGIAAGAP